MLKIALTPFDMTDLSVILAHPIRFVSLEFHKSKIEYCNLVFSHSRDSNVRPYFIRFRGKYFQNETILLPIDSRIMNLTMYDRCCLQTGDPPAVSMGQGIHRSEGIVTMRYAHI